MAVVDTLHPDVFLRFRLPRPVTDMLLAVLESYRKGLTELVDRVPWDEVWPDPMACPSVLTARTFSVRCRRLPAWVALLAILEHFVEIWDDPRLHSKRHGNPIYERDGYRCSAPGCTSRQHLEDHHIKFGRGRRNDALWNRLCACAFCHLKGVHGILASCKGKAPLRVHWRIGRLDLAIDFKNERKSRWPEEEKPG